MQEKREKIRYLDNIKYMFQNWAKWNAKSFMYLLVWVPALIVVPMLGAYVPKAMIDSIEAGVSIPQLVLKITLISGGFVSTARMMRCWSRPANTAAFGTHRQSTMHSNKKYPVIEPGIFSCFACGYFVVEPKPPSRTALTSSSSARP